MVELATNGPEMKKAYDEVCDLKSETNWYEKQR